MPAESRCIWKYDGKLGKWSTDCGWEFPYDYVPIDDFKWCPYCGEVLAEYAPTEEE